MNYVKVFSGLFFLLTSVFSTLAGDKQVALTVYNQNLALVKDVRTLELERGTSQIKFTEVAAKIEPTSVHFKSLTAPDAVTILEQNFEYDLISTDRLLQKYIDERIMVTTREGNTFAGKLLSAAGGDAVIETNEGSVKVVKAAALETVEFPKLPEGLITRPTLVWLLQSDKGGKHKSEVSYLTEGINWHAEYVALSKDDDTKLELAGWVSIDNKSGATYENAKLKLIAGEVHRVEEPRVRRRAAETEMAMLAYAAAEPQFEEKAFFEYHMYTLQRPATVRDRQIKQLSLFPTAKVDVRKIFTYNGARDEKKVRVNLEFVNSKEAGLGIPLPAGKIRAYKEDEDKSQEFIGEDKIEHTPKDEKVRIYLGNAFDVVGERIQKETKKIGKRARQESYEIKLRNHREEDVVITVIEKIWGDWEIIAKSHPFRKKDARTAEFDLSVPKDGETVLEYTVLIQW